MSALVPRDERELSVDRVADRLAYAVVSYGLLVVVAWRSFFNGEAPWDLLGLVVLGGVVGMAYRLRMRATSVRWFLVAGMAMALAAAVAVALVVAVR